VPIAGFAPTIGIRLSRAFRASPYSVRAVGASVADSRVCLFHDQLVAPRDSCRTFAPLR
jgi:hypothetical protein